MTSSARKAGKTAAQLAHLKFVCHPDDLGQLKLDLAIWGACYLDGDGRRVPPRDVPPLSRSTRPLTEASPGALGGVGSITGWYLAEDTPGVAQ